MKTIVDMSKLFEHPEDYGAEGMDRVVGTYGKDVFLMFGKEGGKYYFTWEDDDQFEDYYQKAGEPLRETWNRMISDLERRSK